jgi:hypothetical protein
VYFLLEEKILEREAGGAAARFCGDDAPAAAAVGGDGATAGEAAAATGEEFLGLPIDNRSFHALARSNCSFLLFFLAAFSSSGVFFASLPSEKVNGEVSLIDCATFSSPRTGVPFGPSVSSSTIGSN